MGRVSQKGGGLRRELVQKNRGYRGEVGGIEGEEDGIGVRA